MPLSNKILVVMVLMSIPLGVVLKEIKKANDVKNYDGDFKVILKSETLENSEKKEKVN